MRDSRSHADPMAGREARLERFRTGYADVHDALKGASNADLDRRPADAGWTAREVVHHLADMEAHAYIRLRQLIAEDRPAIHPHDEPAYARRLHYDRPIASSLAVIRAARDSSLELLEALTPEDWTRSGTHSKLAHYDVERWLQVYSEHAHIHADQIRAAIGRT
jgi:hypothetical protein